MDYLLNKKFQSFKSTSSISRKEENIASLDFFTLTVLAMLLVIGGVEKNPGPLGNPSPKAYDKQPNKLQNVLEKLETLPLSVDNITVLMADVIKKLRDTDDRLREVEEENHKLSMQVNTLQNKVDYLENITRRKNLVLKGIPELGVPENYADCKSLVIKALQEEIGLIIDVDDIERAHRLKGNSKPRDVLVTLASYSTKEKILEAKKNLKSRKFFIFEDFSPKVMEERFFLMKAMRFARQHHLRANVSFNKLKINNDIYKYNENTKQIEKVTNVDKKVVEMVEDVPVNKGSKRFEVWRRFLDIGSESTVESWLNKSLSAELSKKYIHPSRKFRR